MDQHDILDHLRTRFQHLQFETYDHQRQNCFRASRNELIYLNLYLKVSKVLSQIPLCPPFDELREKVIVMRVNDDGSKVVRSVFTPITQKRNKVLLLINIVR